MKLKQLKLKNFAQFEDFELVFNDDITHLVGMNGAGKTTVGLTALWAGFKGIAEKSKTGALIGQRFRFITEGKKSLDIEITLFDESTRQEIVLIRHITKTTNTIKIQPQKGGEVSREYVENLFNVAFLSASHFSTLTGKQQAEAMGIDVSEYDKKLAKKKEEAQGFRKDIKKIGDLTPVEECEKSDINALQIQHKAATEHNEEQTRLTAQLSTLRDKIEDIDEDILKEEALHLKRVEAYDARMAELNESRITASTTIKEFPEVEEVIPLEPITKAIAEIVEANETYFKYETYKDSLAEKEETEQYLSDNLLLQKDINIDRRNYLRSKSFGIKGLSIDVDGNLTKDGKLIRQPYFSKGELEVLVARIAMNLNPELKVRFIDDFEMLDTKNQVLLLKNLTKKGFQVITATVGEKKKDNKTVLLRECKVIESSNNVAEQDTGVGDWDEEEAADNETETIKTEEACIDVPTPEASNTADDFDDDDDF